MPSLPKVAGSARKTISAREGADLLGITPRHFNRIAALGKLAVEPPLMRESVVRRKNGWSPNDGVFRVQ
jgi:hypothetical protein